MIEALKHTGADEMIAATTHIEVTKANKGAEVFGLADGMLVRVIKETPKFFFCEPRNASRNGHTQMKVSKTTRRLCLWSNKNTSPVFNV